jgi:hypothetical protein
VLAGQTQRERQREFLLGFWAWWAVNLLGAGATTALAFELRQAAIAFGAVLLIANLAVTLYLTFRRPYMAFGIVVAFASVSAVAVVEGVFSTISDFVGVGAGTAIGGTAGGYFVIGTFVVVGVIALVVSAIVARIILRRVARRL